MVRNKVHIFTNGSNKMVAFSEHIVIEIRYLDTQIKK